VSFPNQPVNLDLNSREKRKKLLLALASFFSGMIKLKSTSSRFLHTQ